MSCESNGLAWAGSLTSAGTRSAKGWRGSSRTSSRRWVSGWWQRWGWRLGGSLRFQPGMAPACCLLSLASCSVAATGITGTHTVACSNRSGSESAAPPPRGNAPHNTDVDTDEAAGVNFQTLSNLLPAPGKRRKL